MRILQTIRIIAALVAIHVGRAKFVQTASALAARRVILTAVGIARIRRTIGKIAALVG